MPNILFVSYDGMTDPLGQSQVIPYLAGLTRYGYQFTILSCEKPEKYHLHKDHIIKILEPYPIKWVPLFYHKNPPVLSSVFDLMVMKRKARYLHSKEKFDMVHTRSGTPALVGLWMKKKLGVKFLNDIRDFYADSRRDDGSWKETSPIFGRIYKYFKNKEREEIAQSDGMVCLTHKAEKIIKTWPYYKPGATLKVIPCSVDLNLFDPDRIDIDLKKEFEFRLDLDEDDIVFSYLGSIGGWYLINEMMSFFKTINDTIQNSKFLFISPNQHEKIYDAASKAGIPIEKIRVTDAQRNEVPVLLSLSDYSVFFIKSCYSKQASSPTKHGEVMAMGIPVITNSGVGDVADIVKKYNSGIILEKLTRDDYLKTAQFLSKEDPFERNVIREGAKNYFSLENAVNEYRNIYDLILKKMD
ncbi:MAG TPA: glycosyltransferase [Hanamia sp.]